MLPPPHFQPPTIRTILTSLLESGEGWPVWVVNIKIKTMDNSIRRLFCVILVDIMLIFYKNGEYDR